MSVPEVRVVEDWHRVLNGGDLEALVALSRPDVEVGGPRGAGRGTALLREWADRVGIRLDPLRIFRRGETVVVKKGAEWRSAALERVTGDQTVASVFLVRDDRVSSVLRYEDLAGALHTANMDESHETGAA